MDAEPHRKETRVDTQLKESSTEPSSSNSNENIATGVKLTTPSTTIKKTSNNESWNKSVGSLNKKGLLVGLVKVKKPQTDVDNGSESVSTKDVKKNKSDSTETANNASNGLSLLGAYSDSESSDWLL